METLRNKAVKFNSQSSYPLTDTTTITNANSITLENVGENVVDYVLTNSGDAGSLEKGQEVIFDTDGGLISDEIVLHFVAPGEIDINWVESETSIIEEQKKTNVLLSSKEQAYIVNLSDVEQSGTATFPMTVDTFQANYTADGTTELDTAPITSQTFATITDLINAWNNEITFFELKYKDETSFYLLAGTRPLPDNNPNLPLIDQSFVSFNDNSNFVFRVFRSAVFIDSFLLLDDGMSNIDQILSELQNTIQQPTYGPALLYKGSGNSINSLPVAAGAKGKISMIKDYGNGQVRFELDGTVPDPNSPTISGRNEAFTEWTGVNFDGFQFAGTSPVGSYYIEYNVQIN